MGDAKTFGELTELLGGFSPGNINSWVFVKSPFSLQHWTMNVVELLLILGALWGLKFALTRYRAGETEFLGCWLASIIFMLAIEVPVYFPELLGADANSLYFIHNEFTVNFFFGRAPLYIMALYPALMFTSYVLVRQTQLAWPRFFIVSSAIAVGTVHHIFYEIFDHFGPQYGWWIWNYPNFGATIASVPVGSALGFAFLGPIGLALAVGWLWRGERDRDMGSHWTRAGVGVVVGKAVLAGLCTPLLMILLMPATWFAVLGVEMTESAELWAATLMLLAAGLCTAGLFARSTTWGVSLRDGFSKRFLFVFLVVFFFLWAFALSDTLKATGGLTDMGRPVGSLPYVALCLVLCLLTLTRKVPSRT